MQPSFRIIKFIKQFRQIVSQIIKQLRKFRYKLPCINNRLWYLCKIVFFKFFCTNSFIMVCSLGNFQTNTCVPIRYRMVQAQRF